MADLTNTYTMEFRTLINHFCMFTIDFTEHGEEIYHHKKQEQHLFHTVPSNGPFHQHKFIEIFYVAEGCFDQILLGKPLHFEKGTVVITDQNCIHCDCYLPQNGTVIFLQLSEVFMNELLSGYESDDTLQAFLFHALSHQKQEHSFLEFKRKEYFAADRISSTVFTLLEEYNHNLPGVKFILKGLLIRLLHTLCSEYTPLLHSSSQENKEKAILYEVERYIRMNCADVTAASLEQLFHYHKNYYNLLFKKYRNKTFKQYVMDVRLMKAKELLDTTTLPVKQIAQLVGYENTSHFYTLYQKKFHHRPCRIQP